jgi:hypothetical protein
MERIATSTAYMNMLQHLLGPCINKDEAEQHAPSQQDDGPSRSHKKVLYHVTALDEMVQLHGHLSLLT